MYTRRTRFPLKPDTTEQAEEIARKYGGILHDLPGHVSTVMFMDDGAMTTITTWDTEEQAEAAASSRDAAVKDLAEILADAPSTTIATTVVHDVAS